MRTLGAWFVLVAIAVAGCDGEEDPLIDGIFTEAEFAIIETLSPLPEVPPDPTNAVADDPDAAALGQMLYFDKTVSGPIAVASDLGDVGDEGTISCAPCHEPTWFTDNRTDPNVSLGVSFGTRNSPTLVNSAFYEWYYWEGRADTLWFQALAAAENGSQQAATRLRIAHVIYDKYRDEYNALFDPDLDPALDSTAVDADRFPPTGKPGDAAYDDMTAADQLHVDAILANYGKVIAAYERLLVSRNAPFDRYVAGDTTAISVAAKRGLKLFVGKAGCVECHETPLFSDNEFHNLGVPQEGPNVPAEDTGRFGGVAKLLASDFNSSGPHSDDTTTGKLDGLAQEESQRGQFRTKHLRQIGETGPYMHTGGFATLADVVDFYDDGGGESGFTGVKDELMVPLNLSSREQEDIVAFLMTLTGEEVPAALQQDTSKP